MVHWHCPFEIDLRFYVSPNHSSLLWRLGFNCDVTGNQPASHACYPTLPLTRATATLPLYNLNFEFHHRCSYIYLLFPLFHQLPPIDYPHKAIDFIHLSIRSNYYQSEDSISFIVVYQPSICFRLRWNTIRCSPLVRKSDPWQCVETFSKYILRLLPSSNWI